ncbi:MAG TPA: DUF2231 domain-containing protein [Blastocatellia bacterium]|nr:DUF2231 domain-containing protein [Blastocatellia bacterium]
MQKAISNRPREIWLMISHRTISGRHLTVEAAIHTLTAQIGVAAFEAALALDTLGWFFGLPRVTTAGYWALMTATGTLTLASFAGFVARRRQRRQPDRSTEAEAAIRRHALLGTFFYVLLVMLTWWRAELQALTGELIAVSGIYLIVLFIASLLLIFQVWLGGEVAVRSGVPQPKG